MAAHCNRCPTERHGWPGARPHAATARLLPLCAVSSARPKPAPPTTLLGPLARAAIFLSARRSALDAAAVQAVRLWQAAVVLALVAGACGLVPARSAAAQQPPAASGSKLDLSADRGWPAGSVQEQMDADPTVVPYGKGAIFVPAMTDPRDEPIVTVFAGEQKVAQATTGRRIIVAPGTYTVRFGSGTVQQRFRKRVQVRELNTTVVPVSWAGLVVHVVDERFNSLRSSYELIRMEDREYLGVGFGSNEQAGEPVSTWVLEPGLYKIVKVGSTYRARSNFVTVRLIEGHLTDFILVRDADTGAFKGGGEATIEELFRSQQGLWWNLVVGGDLSFNSNRNVLGNPDGESYSFRAFLDGKLNFSIGDNPLLFQLQIEEGQTKTLDLPWQKNRDRVDLDGLYVHELSELFGAYGRFGGETNFFVGQEFFEQPQDVIIQDPAGRTLERRNRVRALQLSPAFGLTQLKEGVGVNVRIPKTVFSETTFRLGVGARHRVTRDLVERFDDPTTEALEFRRIAPANQLGIEATVLGLFRITRWVIVNLELDTLVPFGNPLGVVVDADATLSVKATQYLSLNYVIRYLRDPTILTDYQLEQDILLRFSLALP